MTEYPYNFGNGYKVQTVFANKTETGVYGDIYDFRSEAERAHPGAEIMVGYCVIDEALGLIPDGCNDWNDTISEAIQDYEEHIVPILEAPLTFIFDEEISVSEDVTDRRMDMVYDQMPEDDLNRYFAKYNIGPKASLSAQIQSASSRADGAQSSSATPEKEYEPEK